MRPKVFKLGRAGKHREGRAEREGDGRPLDRLSRRSNGEAREQEQQHLHHRDRHRQGLDLAHGVGEGADGKEHRPEQKVAHGEVGDAQQEEQTQEVAVVRVRVARARDKQRFLHRTFHRALRPEEKGVVFLAVEAPEAAVVLEQTVRKKARSVVTKVNCSRFNPMH